MKNLNAKITYNHWSTVFIYIGATILTAIVLNVVSYMLIYRFAEVPLVFTVIGMQFALVSISLSGIFIFLVRNVHSRYRFLNYTLR